MAALRIRRDDGWVDGQPQSPEASRCTDRQGSVRAALAPVGRGAWPRDGGPLRRQVQGRFVGGVAAGISARTGISANIIRTVFVISSFMGGFGAVVYVLAWLFVPAVGDDGSIASRAQSDRRGIALAAGTASLLAVILFIASLLHVGWLGSLSWPPVIALAGLVLIRRNASADEQAVMRRLTEPILGGALGSPRSGSPRPAGVPAPPVHCPLPPTTSLAPLI